MDNIKDSHRLRTQIVSLVRDLSLLNKNEASVCGITLAQCHAIIEIGRAGELYLNKLAEILKLDKSTMSRTVDNLVKQDYVIREVDAENRKFIKIKLSEKGYELFKSTEENMERYYNDVLEDIPKCKRQQILEDFDILLEALENVNGSKEDNENGICSKRC